MHKFKLIAFFSLVMIACSNTTVDTSSSQMVQPIVHFDTLSPTEKLFYMRQAEELYKNILLKNKAFSGGILVAKNGDIVLEDYQGFIDFKNKIPITANTPIHIASTSKTFTSIVILRLMEQGKLSLDQTVDSFFPLFPYKNISIKDLLSHRSGLPNYTHFMDGPTVSVIKKRNKKGRIIKIFRIKKDNYVPAERFVTNQSLLNFLITRKPAPNAMPNRVFQYCNTNYALLALIAEHVSGISFPNYLRDSVFLPLGMKDSYVFSIQDTNHYIPSYQPNGAPFGIQKLDCVYGDKNVYSTVRDLLKWDIALYQAQFVSANTLNMAFAPYSNERKGEHNYGLGFRLLVRPTETIVYHNGWWHGNNAVFKRLIKDTATVIVLGNRFNKGIYAAGKISSIFTGGIDTTKTID
jgi:CubicO group peptidase (beta-lactamase class C family)